MAPNRKQNASLMPLVAAARLLAANMLNLNWLAALYSDWLAAFYLSWLAAGWS